MRIHISAQMDLESIIALLWIRIFSLDFMAYVDYMAYEPYNSYNPKRPFSFPDVGGCTILHGITNNSPRVDCFRNQYHRVLHQQEKKYRQVASQRRDAGDVVTLRIISQIYDRQDAICSSAIFTTIPAYKLHFRRILSKPQFSEYRPWNLTSLNIDHETELLWISPIKPHISEY